jgi:hypothetical protein
MHKKIPLVLRKYIGALFTGILFFIFLSSTNPQNIEIHWFILPALFVFIFFYFFFGAVFSVLFGKNIKYKVIVTASALFVSLLVILQSLGQLTYRDMVLSLIFMLVSLFFLRRADYI